MWVTTTQIVRAVAEWPVRSQQVARRNALVCATPLADRRRERIDVEEFLEQHLATRARLDVAARGA